MYALGAILYEMLTGRPPFKGETPIETVRQVVEDEVVPPSRLVPRVARDLETICLQCLHKEPSRRYGSARSLAEDLQNYLAGRPVAARRTPLWERGVKLARRHTLATTLFTLGLVATFGPDCRLAEIHLLGKPGARPSCGPGASGLCSKPRTS